MRGRLQRVLWLALLVLPLVAGGAQAQAGLAPAVSLTGPGDLDLDAGETRVVTFRLVNDGPTDADVALDLRVPEGWSAQLSSTTLRLPSGGAEEVTLDVTAPAAGEGAADGDVLVAAALTDDLGRTAADEAGFGVARIDPPPAPTPWYLRASTMAAGAVLLLGCIVAGGVVAGRRHRERVAWERRERAYTVVTVGEPVKVPLRRECSVRVRVTNLADEARRFHLRVEGSDGWRGGVSAPTLTVAGHAHEDVSVAARVDDAIRPGARGRLTLVVRAAEAQQHEERVALDLVAPDAGRGPRPRASPPPA